MRIAVAGGTGAVGRHVVEVARAKDHDVLLLTRRDGVDLTRTRPDLAGVDVVVDVTSIQTLAAAASLSFFRAVTANLLEAERAAGVAHHVLLSIVGVDSAPHGYYAGKAAQEAIVSAGDVPWTILRATQFHEFAGQLAMRTRVGPLAFVPAMRSQPVAARDVAERLVEIAEAGPSGRVTDLAGPREERMAHLSQKWLTATGSSRRVVEVPLPGPLGRAMRNGSLLPGVGTRHSRESFDQWLAELP